MSTINATRIIDAPRSAVWAVLADFANIASWTDQVKTSVAIGEPVVGVGQGRHCDLSPAGQVDEEIIEYIPEELMGIRLFNFQGLPLKGSITHFALADAGPGRTEVSMTADPTFKGGPAGGVLKKAAAGKLRQGLAQLLDDLAVASERQAAVSAD